MKDFIITSDWIDRYNANELEEAERTFFQRQMVQNPLLRTEVFIDANLNTLLSDEDLLELMHKVQSVTRRTNQSSGLMNYLLIAATVICLIILGAVLYLVEKKPVSLPPFAKQQLTLPREQQIHDNLPGNEIKYKSTARGKTTETSGELSRTQLLAENYKTMSEFELLVGSVTRASEISLVAPPANLMTQAGIPVRFKWISKNNQHPVTIVLMNNHGNIVFETSPLHVQEYTLHTKGIPLGLYYWKIMLEDELVIIGKLTLY